MKSLSVLSEKADIADTREGGGGGTTGAKLQKKMHS